MRALLFVALLAPAVAVAKDDTPNARQLALQHPWHPLEPSSTKIEVRCGKESSTYELRIDDRDGIYLIGKNLEAFVAPFGRFLKTKSQWSPIDRAAWLEPRAHGLSLRELTGSPWLPDAWTVKSQQREKDGTIAVSAVDQQKLEHAMTFDAISNVWMAELRGGKEWLKVLETKQLGVRMLPSKIEIAGGCTMTRTVSAGLPSMPQRAELPVD